MVQETTAQRSQAHVRQFSLEPPEEKAETQEKNDQGPTEELEATGSPTDDKESPGDTLTEPIGCQSREAEDRASDPSEGNNATQDQDDIDKTDEQDIQAQDTADED